MNPLAIALQGIGYSPLLVALQGLIVDLSSTFVDGSGLIRRREVGPGARKQRRDEELIISLATALLVGNAE